MTNETRKVEILTKHGEFVEKIEKAEKGYNLILKPGTKVAELNGSLVLNNPRGLAEVYDSLKRLVRQAGGSAAASGVKPKKAVKEKVVANPVYEDIQLEVVEDAEPAPQPLDPITIKRPRRVIG